LGKTNDFLKEEINNEAKQACCVVLGLTDTQDKKKRKTGLLQYFICAAEHFISSVLWSCLQ